MKTPKIGISLEYNYNITDIELVSVLSNIGFDAISPVWVNDKRLPLLVEHARSAGLIIQSLHAPYGRSADMWSEDKEKADAAINELSQALDDCKSLNIPMLVCHAWIGFGYTQKVNTIGLDNFRIIVDKAKNLGISIAFENTEGEEFLLALLGHFNDYDNVGFCWDSGHEICFNRSADLLAMVGNRLIMTHLNDNLGISDPNGKIYWTDDLHLLPYDGVSDWEYNVRRLKKCPELKIINFELTTKSKPGRHENDKYNEMSIEDYFSEVYKRAKRIAADYLE